MHFSSSLTLGALIGAAVSPVSSLNIERSPAQKRDPANGAPSAADLIAKGLAALGGEDAISKITGVTFYAPEVYRSQSLMESFSPLQSDTFIATGGSQNMSFSYTQSVLQQRIDRYNYLSGFWLFGDNVDAPRMFSLVLQGGSDGFACYVHGNNYIYDPPAMEQGYADAALAEYLIHRGYGMSPLILASFKQNNVSTSSMITLRDGVTMPAIHDSTLDLTMIFDPATNLPYIIRSTEDHYVFGPSTSDFLVYNYTSEAGVMFPRHFKTIYNDQYLLEDFIVSEVSANPTFPTDFFQGAPANESMTPKVAPAKVDGYSHAEIGEWSANMLWAGNYTGTLANLSATHPLPDVPNLWFLQFQDAPGYSQLIMEFENGVIVADSPPHQSLLIIQWIKQTLNKPITHLWPSHHHHDHNYGARDYVKVGAKIITPTIAVPYWSEIPGVQLEVYDDQNPFIFKDSTLQARFNWNNEAVHAEDWSYATVTKACPGPNDGIVAFVADSWSPAFVSYEFDAGAAIQWLNQAAADGLGKNAIVTPAHGIPTPLTVLLEMTGFAYPNYTTTDWKHGGKLC